MADHPKYKVAAAHIAPVFNDNNRSVDKACDVVAEAARQNIRLLAFPESFLPSYPMWSRAARPTESEAYFAAFAANALRIDGPEIRRLREAARRHGIFISMGFTEGTPISVGCLWNSNVLIGADGAILNHHRKLVPTFFEKLVYASGDGAGLRVSETEIGRIGMLICGENTNPLARYALMAQGEQVHIASYPSVTLARSADGEGAFNLNAGIRIRAACHSFEAKAFTIVSSTYYDKTARAGLEPLGKEILARFDAGSPSVSMVIDPSGECISEELSTEEGLAVAEIDLARAVELKRVHDVVGYYNRFDIFNLTVNRTANRPVTFKDDNESNGPEHKQTLADDGKPPAPMPMRAVSR
ncbi:MAG: carbon-nitrogen hydrolase family protein [Burkholderiales bacterium]|nr:carbon-nitrogen hydrolase family protein [Burkholderiales bacterium]